MSVSMLNEVNMSLMIYKNGVVSADKRIGTLSNVYSFDTDTISKIFISDDKRLLISSVGLINSKHEHDLLKIKIEELYGKYKDAWIEEFIISKEAKTFFGSDGPVIFLFFQNHFFIISNENNLKYEEIDLNHFRVAGSGSCSAMLLFRSKYNFELKTIYRIVSSAANTVSSEFEQVSINTIKGFS